MRQLPSDLSSKINQSLQTIGNNADPKMEITVARAKNTVYDSTYWTVETIREIDGLGDVSVAPRRFNIYGRPNRIYEVHVRNGEVLTSVREYPDKLREGFKPQFSLGAGSSVGLAFNGEWKRYRKFYRLVTEDEPWISWVDNAGVLWVQRWDDVDSNFQLSSDVVKVKMIRAWKNLVIQHQDHGIVVAYIKTDGKVYYRNYCIQEDYSEAWEYEKELTSFTGSAVNVNLFITNDYRMGFIVEDNVGKIHWFVTHRNWGGMASPADNISTGITDITLQVIPITYYETLEDEYIVTAIQDIWLNVAEPIYPAILGVNNGDGDEFTIWMKINHEVHPSILLAKNAFTIKDSLNKIFNIISIEQDIDKSIIVFNMERFTSASGDMTITYNRAIYEVDCPNQGSLFALESSSFTFTPELTPPEGHALENLLVDIIPTLTVTQVYYKDRYAEENITTGISNISIIVTKVGSNPL